MIVLVVDVICCIRVTIVLVVDVVFCFREHGSVGGLCGLLM